MKKQILVVDDHAVFRSGLRRLLERSEEFAVAGETDDPEKAMHLAQKLKPDLAIVDIMLGSSDGIELAREMAAKFNVPILILSIHDETSFALRALNAGAKGYVMKDQPFDVLLKAIRDILAGKTFIGERVKAKLAKLTNRSQG